MVDVFDKLRSLQEVLSEKYDLQAEIEEAPKQLSTQNINLAIVKEDFIKHNSMYEDLKSKVGKLKSDLAEAEAAREKSEKGMDDITSHREYEALDKEIKDATDKAHYIRKELETKEKELAEINDTLKNDEAQIQALEAELNESKASMQNEVSQYESKLKDLEAQEASLSEGIDSEIIFKFKRIVKSKHNKGIVAVKGNVCDGCHMILPAQFANDVHSGEKIVFCPYCSRILFYQEVEGEEEQYYQMEDTGSLVDLDDDFDDEDYDEDDESEDRETIKELDF